MMAAKPADTIGIKVRMKESLRRKLKVEADRDGISVNAAIERRLNRTLIDDGILEIINQVADKVSTETANKLAIQIKDYLESRMMAERAALEFKIAQMERVQSLHEVILKKGGANG
jgi:hypothetical protein